MLHIVNYIVRVAVIVAGLIFALGVISPADGDDTRFRVMGIVFILFGIYRIIMYRMKSKQYNFKSTNDENDTDTNND
jgi:hypothetical protein